MVIWSIWLKLNFNLKFKTYVQLEVDVYFRSLILPRGDNYPKYGNPAKLLFMTNANFATFKITVGGIRDLKYTLTQLHQMRMLQCPNSFQEYVWSKKYLINGYVLYFFSKTAFINACFTKFYAWDPLYIKSVMTYLLFFFFSLEKTS